MEILPPGKIKIVLIEGKGRGVVATEDISKGEVIERCPILILGDKDTESLLISSDVLKHYFLELTSIEKHVLMLGYGMLYNHSFEGNSDVDTYVIGSNEMVYRALCDIRAGDEIVFDYGGFENKIVEFLSLD